MTSLFLSVCVGFMLLFIAASHAEQQDLPHFFGNSIRLPKPDLSQYDRVRFLTTVDFWPFSYINEEGVLSGYNVDLARALCDDLDIVARCQIEALPFDQLQNRLLSKGGEAIIAGLAPNLDNRQFLSFSHPYLVFPARFIALKGDDLQKLILSDLTDMKIGVVAKSKHAQMAHAYFPKADILELESYQALYEAVLSQQVALGFGDGLRFSQWLSTPDNGAKAEFFGEPYLNSQLLGQGMQIAVRYDDDKLVNAFDYSLRRLEQNGKLKELYLRYFPIGFF